MHFISMAVGILNYVPHLMSGSCLGYNMQNTSFGVIIHMIAFMKETYLPELLFEGLKLLHFRRYSEKIKFQSQVVNDTILTLAT
jgi:hypothetical protein